MRQIEDALVVGVGVHGGHRTGNDPEEAFHDEGYRSKAVRGARGVGNDMVLGRIVVVVVYAHDDGEVFFLRRGCNDDFLGAVLDVDMGLFGGTENTRGFDHHVDAIGSPGEELGIAFREAMDLPVAHGGIVAFHHGVKIGTAVVRIVFEQMEVGFRIEEVVDGDDFHFILIFGVQSAEDLPADTAETVDADSYFLHVESFSLQRPDSCRTSATRS